MSQLEVDVTEVSKARPSSRSVLRRVRRIAPPRNREAALQAAVERLAQNPTVILDRLGRTLFLSREARLILDSAEARSSFGALVSTALARNGEHARCSFPGQRASLQVEAHVVCTAGSQAFVVATIDRETPSEQQPPARWGLTRAETTVLRLLADGLSNREIAARLFVSLDTVKTHVHRVLEKSGAHSRTKLLVCLRDQS